MHLSSVSACVEKFRSAVNYLNREGICKSGSFSGASVRVGVGEACQPGAPPVCWRRHRKICFSEAADLWQISYKAVVLLLEL